MTSRSTRPPGISAWPRAARSGSRYGPCITCDEVVTDGDEVVELRCHHVPDSIGKNPPASRSRASSTGCRPPSRCPPKSAFTTACSRDARPGGRIRATNSTPTRWRWCSGARLEPSLAAAEPGSRWQLERVGYFVFDTDDSQPDAPVLNRIVTLRDSWQRPRPARRHRRPANRRGQARTSTRPPKKSRIEYRAEARVRDPLLADRFASLALDVRLGRRTRWTS